MTNTCAACCKRIKDAFSLRCASCDGAYHILCVSMNQDDFQSLSEELRNGWTCPACCSKRPKGDNSDTPIRSSTSSGAAHPNVTLRGVGNSRKAAPVADTQEVTGTDPLKSLISEIRLMREDINDLKNSFNFISETIAQCNARLDIQEQRMREQDRVGKQRELEIITLKSTITELQDKLDAQDQTRLRNELEIMGINEDSNENLEHLVLVAAVKVGVDLKDTDIDWVARAGPRPDAAANSTEAKMPRPVIVRLLRRKKRDEFLKNAKARRNITSTDFNLSGQTRKVFVNEHLTRRNRYLFREARQRASLYKVKYCWTRHGTILVRRQKGAPAIVIRNIEDLDRHLGPATADPAPEVQHEEDVGDD